LLTARRHTPPSLSGFSSRLKLLEYELGDASATLASTDAIVVGVAAMVGVDDSAACALIDPVRINATTQPTLKYVVRMVDNMLAPFLSGRSMRSADQALNPVCPQMRVR
jgi:hypothetical protein